MANIRHIAILTKDTDKLAEFYRKAFGLAEVGRNGEGGEHGRAIFLSDGYINLAILPSRDRGEGLWHFGIEVADVNKATQIALEAGATGGTDEVPQDGRFVEKFVFDPIGNRVDLAPGWKV